MSNSEKKPCICTAGDPCDYHAASCTTCKGMCAGHPQDFEGLVTRVQNGILCGADSDIITQQLKGEGIPEDTIAHVITKATRLADVRVGKRA